jgi:transcriptional regulator with XRE-family HTH domain
MSELLGDLKRDFSAGDKEYRHAYADERLNAMIATQIKVLREQRGWRQEDLAEEAEMHQPMISRYENVNYSSWSIKTLKQLAHAFDVVLQVNFESFGEMARDVDRFSRESLQVPEFSDDPFFVQFPVAAAETRTPAVEGAPIPANFFAVPAAPGTTLDLFSHSAVDFNSLPSQVGDNRPSLASELAQRENQPGLEATPVVDPAEQLGRAAA